MRMVWWKESSSICLNRIVGDVTQFKMIFPGVPVVAQWLTNLTRSLEVAGSVPALAQWVKGRALP